MKTWLPSNKPSANRMWSEYTAEPYGYFCIVNKDKKEVVFMEGTVSPFKTAKIAFKDYKAEDALKFSEQKRIEIKDYVNS